MQWNAREHYAVHAARTAFLEPYTYTQADGGVMTVNGELHKLAHNISFGHGIHEGIHWRSDTDYSMLLGEEVALIVFKETKSKLTAKKLDNDHKNERTNVRSYQKFIAAAQRKPGTPAIGNCFALPIPGALRFKSTPFRPRRASLPPPAGRRAASRAWTWFAICAAFSSVPPFFR